MADGLIDLVEQYGSKGVIVDTNLLLLWIVGVVEESLVLSFKRTQQFVPEDYRSLDALLARFSVHVCTPSVLTEVSNLIGQLSGEFRTRSFQRLAAAIAVLEERYVASRELAEDEYFTRIGLPDCSIKTIGSAGLLVLTDDFQLYGILNSVGIDCINFNHIRPYGWN